MQPWFSEKKCSRLVVTRMKSESGDKLTHTISIDDSKAIERLIKRIEAISPDGDMMKSMLIDEEIHLTFECGSRRTAVEVYDGRFKTPTTGFNSGEGDRKLEALLYRDLKALLFPKLGDLLLVVENLVYDLGDFSLEYKGTEVREQKPGEPTLGPISKKLFRIHPKEGSDLDLTVRSGQNAPQPLEFAVGKKNYTLFTFFDEKSNRIDPDYFKVMMRK